MRDYLVLAGLVTLAAIGYRTLYWPSLRDVILPSTTTDTDAH